MQVFLGGNKFSLRQCHPHYTGGIWLICGRGYNDDDSDDDDSGGDDDDGDLLERIIHFVNIYWKYSNVCVCKSTL